MHAVTSSRRPTGSAVCALRSRDGQRRARTARSGCHAAVVPARRLEARGLQLSAFALHTVGLPERRIVAPNPGSRARSGDCRTEIGTPGPIPVGMKAARFHMPVLVFTAMLVTMVCLIAFLPQRVYVAQSNRPNPYRHGLHPHRLIGSLGFVDDAARRLVHVRRHDCADLRCRDHRGPPLRPGHGFHHAVDDLAGWKATLGHGSVASLMQAHTRFAQ